jgi:hypothetical protein
MKHCGDFGSKSDMKLTMRPTKVASRVIEWQNIVLPWIYLTSPVMANAAEQQD